MNFKSSGSQDSLVKKIFSVGHTDHDNVVESFDSIDICKKLIYNLIAHLRSNSSSVHASLFANSVNFIKNYNMKRTFVT